MFEELERGWTEGERTALGKAIFALSILMLAFLLFVGIFEPRMIEHGFFDVILGLGLFALAAGMLLKQSRAKWHGSN
ncbi:MAG TPA: hypothetical protein VGT04_14875 [Acidobacteriaceae bacterium]|nr:hypothetical protein [Acidobacteriaceae bacterium]